MSPGRSENREALGPSFLSEVEKLEARLKLIRFAVKRAQPKL